MATATWGRLRQFLMALCFLGGWTLGALPAYAEEAGICAPAPVACDCPDNPCCACRTPTEPTCPAKYDNLRFRELWDACRCVPCCDRDDWTDALKARAIGGGSMYVNVGGQLRLRYESFSHIGFGAPADDHDAWMLLRVRAHADLHLGRSFRVFVEGIYADQIEERELGPRPIDQNRGDLLNAFVEGKGRLGIGELGAWVGRRELQTGKQRLVSPLDWANTRRTFQGVGAWWKRGFHRVDAWVTRPVVIEDRGFDEEDDDVLFWGLDYENRTCTCVTWAAYVYGLDIDNATDETRYTIGARADGKIPGTRLDYDLEAAYQFGEVGSGDVSAWMASATLGWRPCTRCGDPRIALGLDYASGDDDDTDPDVGTFHQLFPLAHKHLGHADLIGRRNIIAGRLEASYALTKQLKLNAWLHQFWRADDADAVYAVTGGVLRGAGTSNDTAVGTELDVKLTWKIDRHWTAFIEWAHFFAGDFLEDTGAHKDVDVWYLSAQATF